MFPDPRQAAVVLAGVTLVTLWSCAPSATRGGFDSPNPAARLYAIHGAGRSGDKAAVPRLVECLESDDGAVRMMAIVALQRITGERRGFDPYAPAEQRQVAVREWAAAIGQDKTLAAVPAPEAGEAAPTGGLTAAADLPAGDSP
jgi:hypothetical protein